MAERKRQDMTPDQVAEQIAMGEGMAHELSEKFSATIPLAIYTMAKLLVTSYRNSCLSDDDFPEMLDFIDQHIIDKMKGTNSVFQDPNDGAWRVTFEGKVQDQAFPSRDSAQAHLDKLLVPQPL